ncbi:MAG: hypothetical protein U0263_06510 [Polyangiaceae bacterium]
MNRFVARTVSRCLFICALTSMSSGCESPVSLGEDRDAGVSDAAADAPSEGGPGCVWQGKTYAYGALAPCSDGCNFGYCSAEFMGGLANCHAASCFCTATSGVWRMGETFPEGDGCTTCTCSSCTPAVCPKGKCSFAGKDYAVGETFPAGDCSTCACTADGIECTVVDPKREYFRHYELESEAACQGWQAKCPPNTKAFGNRCGCGCEQSKDCPDWIDCKPPNDCAAEVSQCPYSGTY